MDFTTHSDAGVYRLSDELAVVQTVDYITPVVNDPYDFGAIAAANALSDIYAMGARPITALNLVGFPAKTLPLTLLGEMLRGAADKAQEAGVSIVGGHSIDDSEPKFGLSVLGTAHPDALVTNARAQAGDDLILTKPLGSGILTTGLDRQLLDETSIGRITAVMSTLNATACQVMLDIGVHACTDVTGFGLLGHLHEMARASGVQAQVHLDQVPLFPLVWQLIEAGVAPQGTHNNHLYVRDHVRWSPHVSHQAQLVLCDAQTSGGLLMAVAPDRSAALLRALHDAGIPDAQHIGSCLKGTAGTIVVEH